MHVVVYSEGKDGAFGIGTGCAHTSDETNGPCPICLMCTRLTTPIFGIRRCGGLGGRSFGANIETSTLLKVFIGNIVSEC